MTFCPTRLWLRTALALAAAAAGGCATYPAEDLDAMQARHREDLHLLQEQIRMTQGRLEGIEIELQRLAADLDAVRRLATTASDSSMRMAQSKLQELEGRIARLDAARESDRQAIVDDLSRRMADVLKRAAPASARAAPVRRSGAVSGYEHTVQPNETLSAIAAAYGVSMSVIAQENNITDPAKIRVGQKLFIPER